MSRRGVLVMFVRAPRVGTVKSRLARTIGPVAAWRIYREMTATVLNRVAADRRWSTRLAVTPDQYAGPSRFWPAAVPRLPQGAGDLGARMARALKAFPHRPVLIIGSDIPDIGPDQIARAFTALETADYVFGPATDGGYWLVGASPRAPVAHLFDNVRWSSPHALADTLANIDGRRDYALLETLEDVDDAETLARWRQDRGETSEVDGP